jgi:hypothetical protein
VKNGFRLCGCDLQRQTKNYGGKENCNTSPRALYGLHGIPPQLVYANETGGAEIQSRLAEKHRDRTSQSEIERVMDEESAVRVGRKRTIPGGGIYSLLFGE